MAVRTTSDAVSGIIEVDTTISLTPFIETANALVTKHCAEKNTAYTATELEIIERWLSAHCYCMRDPRPTDEGVKGITMTYQSKVDLCFYTSHYGQMAMMLDWFGGLAALAAQAKAGGAKTVGITWLGTEDDELEDEDELDVEE